MADSGEGAAKRCEIDVDLPSRSSDGGGPRGAARPLQDLLDSTHEDDAAIARIEECVAEGILSSAEAAEQSSLASRGAQQSPRMLTHNVIKLSVQELSKYFKMPEKAVAKHLGIDLTSLKKICRANGINRWPYHTARYDRCCEEEERICKLAGSQERFETYRICKLAGSQERFETHGRTRARVQCPAPSPAPTPDTISTIRVTAHAS
jgi:hypothetical protein